MLILTVLQGCEMKVFNGSSFFTLLKRKIRVNTRNPKESALPDLFDKRGC
jgi:hypothetical protein